MPGTPSPISVSTKLERVAKLARQAPQMVMTTLAHLIDVDLLREAHRRTRKDGVVGVDGQTAADYAANLELNLQSLLDRFKSGTYRAPPVRRVYIPKADGTKLRPIGIPTFEDKILQRAVVMVLEAIYEQDFLDCSYGFRPGRSAHQALDRLREGLTKMGGGVVIELDIKSFFDSVSHGHLRDFLDQRVRDGDIRRAIDKWLNAGVLEAGAVMHPDQGTPQGGVISPLLANIFLHEVLDRWFESEVKPRLVGEALLIRYADDAVIVLAKETDAQRVMRVLPKRFERYGLMLHPEKTRMVPFRRPRAPLPGRGRGTFDLLGFTHYWGRSRKGYWVVKRKTAASRLRRALLTIGLWCRKNRHLPVAEQQQGLNQKLRGHYGYFGITGNFRALAQLIEGTRRHWQRWLNRRSQRAHMPWERFNSLLKQYPLARPRVVHSVYGRAVSP